MKKTIQNHIKNTKGNTLLELMVSMVVMSIIFTLAVALVFPAMQIQMRIKQMNSINNTLNLVMDKIQDEVRLSEGISIASDGKVLSYFHPQKGVLTMQATKPTGFTAQVLTIKDDSTGEWYLSEKAYGGSTIESLEFEPVAGKPDLVTVKIKVKILGQDRVIARERTIKVENR